MTERFPPATFVREDRIWATQWYRTRPETFEYFELFFEPDRISGVFGDESFKSMLLRRDGREQEAHEIGEESATAPTEDLLRNQRSFAVETGDVTRIRVTEGSLLLKPKLEIETPEQTREFYHHSRSHEVGALYEVLDEMYEGADFDVVRRERGLIL